MSNKVTNLTLPSGETVEIQDAHAITLDENITISGTFDFGKVTGAGNYNVPLNALNGPSGVSVTTGTLKVLYDHDKPVQIYIHRITNQIYVRFLSDGGSWSTWLDITNNDNLQSQITTNNSNLTKEITDRTSADSALQANINSEATTRSKADIDLQSSISQLSSKIDNYWKTVYPVGSIYLSFSSTNPSQLFGGSWNKLSNSFLVGAGDKYALSDTGGEETHTLTEDEIPPHRHNSGRYTGYELSNIGMNSASSGTTRQVLYANTSSTAYSEKLETTTTGGGQAHNNLPPYIAVNMWRRIG